MQKYFINHENKLEENDNGNLVSAKDCDMMKMRMEGDAKANVKALQDQIQILQWELDASI